jgi:hypothetical protein
MTSKATNRSSQVGYGRQVNESRKAMHTARNRSDTSAAVIVNKTHEVRYSEGSLSSSTEGKCLHFLWVQRIVMDKSVVGGATLLFCGRYLLQLLSGVVLLKIYTSQFDHLSTSLSREMHGCLPRLEYRKTLEGVRLVCELNSSPGSVLVFPTSNILVPRVDNDKLWGDVLIARDKTDTAIGRT